MKIISDFHDYYDRAFGHDSDESRIYRRKVAATQLNTVSAPFPAPLKKLFSLYPSRDHYRWFDITHHLPIRRAALCFCGRAFPILIRDGCGECGPHKPVPDAQIENVSPIRLIDEFKSRPRGEWKTLALDRTSQSEIEKDVREVLPKLAAFIKSGANVALSEEFFRLVTAPIAIVPNPGYWYYSAATWHCVTNVRLKDFDFRMDARACYQEIETYLGSVLTAPDIAPLRVGSDDVVARQKGFDEWSFRTKTPGQKKLNRQVNRSRKRSGSSE